MSSPITMMALTPSAWTCCAMSDAQRAVDGLAAGHRDGVVVEDLVGDVDLGRDACAHGQRARVEVGAIAEVLEDVIGFAGERRLADPRRAFAAHLGEGVGAPVHPGDHVVAADAAERRASLPAPRSRCCAGSPSSSARRAGSSRAAAPVRLPCRRGSAGGPRSLADVKKRDRRLAMTRAMHRRRQFAGARQHPVFGLVVLADDRGRRACSQLYMCSLSCASRKERFSSTTMMSSRPGEGADALRLERPGHADLVDADADVARSPRRRGRGLPAPAARRGSSCRW
jgi:hypothetical protein